MKDPACNSLALHRQLDAIWRTPPRKGRLSAVNHNIIGKRFILTSLVFFAVGGVLAMLIRAQLATPRSAFLGPEIYNQIFTMHGTVMMFLFAIPLFEGLAMYLLPKMLGARDMAFPRLSAYGFWCYLFGGSILLAAMAFGVAPDSGWFMYTPLSSKPYTPGINADVWLLGITFVEISALSAAIEIIVTILKLRAPGMSLEKMPLFGWYMLVTAFMMLFGFPPLILGSILLELERAFDLPFFDPTRGGNPLLWQHLFWLFGHPEVYIIFLPAAGMVSTILPVLVGRKIIGYLWIVVSIVALAFLSFGLWVHHMFAVGVPHLALGFFSAASTAVAVPTAVQIFAWLGTLLAGRPQLKLPMFYLLGFFSIFVMGGLTGVMLAVVPFNWQVHDTHFVVAHLHYVLVGGFIFPMLAAAYYWLPHFTGRETRYSFGITAFWLIFIGFNATFLIMHLTGLLGMPRRVYTYDAASGWEWLNLVSSIGSFILAIGFALVAVDLLMQWRMGKRSAHNPWKADTLEWTTARPAPSYNFASIPSVERRYPFSDARELGNQLARGEGFLGFTRNGQLETLGVETTSGKTDQVILLPRPSFLPFVSGIATASFFLSLLFKFYWLAPIALIGIIGTFLLWTRDCGARRTRGPIEIGLGQRALPHIEASAPPSRMAIMLVLCADATAYVSLIFGFLFLWVVAPNWPPPYPASTSPLLTIAGIVLMSIAAAAGFHASQRKTLRNKRAREFALIAAMLAHIFSIAILLMLIRAAPDPTLHAHAAATLVLLVYAGIRLTLGIVFASFAFHRSRQGYVSETRPLDIRIGALWHIYAAATGSTTLLLLESIHRVMQ